MPVTWLVVGLVVRKVNAAGRLVAGTRPQAVAVVVPVLMMTAKAVATLPACTERLAGSTEATGTIVVQLGLLPGS